MTMENQGFDAYDIQCLLHVYNKFGNSSTTTTNINELLPLHSIIRLHTTSYYENHPCIISKELAIFLGQPIGSIFTPNQVKEMIIQYCFDRQLITLNETVIDNIEMTHDEDEDKNDYECTSIELTNELKQLLKCKRHDIVTRNLVSYLAIHLTMVEPTGQYVLK